MKLLIFKTLWGHTGSFEEAACDAMTAHFDGIEAPVPQHPAQQNLLAEILESSGLLYISEICTAGSYVPERRADVNTHLASLESAIRSCLYLKPEFINCIGGCDAWSLGEHLNFFSEADATRQAIPGRY